MNGDQFEQFEKRWTTGAKLTHRRLAAHRRASRRRTRSAWTCATTRSAGRSASITRAQTERLDDHPRRRGRIRRRSACSARRRSSGAARSGRRSACAATSTTGTSTSNNPLNSGDEDVGHRQPEGVGGVRPLGRHRVLRQLGTRLPLELRPRHHAATSIRHRRPGRRRRRRSRARKAPSSACARVARQGAADDGHGLVSRLRFGADLRRRLRQHRGGAGEPPHGRRDHQLHLPEPLGRRWTSTSRSRGRASWTCRRARTSCPAR